jgi:hypothetical protein
MYCFPSELLNYLIAVYFKDYRFLSNQKHEPYCRVPQLGVPKLRWKTTRPAQKTKNKPNANLPRLREKINIRAKFFLAGLPTRRVSKPAHLPASSEASRRGGSRNTSDSSDASALGLGHRPTHDNFAASSEP